MILIAAMYTKRTGKHVQGQTSKECSHTKIWLSLKYIIFIVDREYSVLILAIFWLLHHLTWMRDLTLALPPHTLGIYNGFCGIFPCHICEFMQYSIMTTTMYEKWATTTEENKNWIKWLYNVMCDYKFFEEITKSFLGPIIFNYLILSANFASFLLFLGH